MKTRRRFVSKDKYNGTHTIVSGDANKGGRMYHGINLSDSYHTISLDYSIATQKDHDAAVAEIEGLITEFVSLIDGIQEDWAKGEEKRHEEAN